jgi:ABC-type multidrug transport system permease subunit
MQGFVKFPPLCYYSLTRLHSSMSLFAYPRAFILILVDGIVTVFLNGVYDFSSLLF